MKKSFVIAAGPLSRDEERAITEHFRDKYAWWHWIDGFWLIIDSSGNLTAQDIRDHLHQVAPSARLLALEVQGISDWAGIGPETEGKNMFRWIRKYWLEELEKRAGT
jgi:hypothetical protein